jgi:soluble lytic murein transglycosylase-like protein
LLAGTPLGAHAQSVAAGTLPSYARALQRFNPELDDATAANFATATIAQADREALDARLLVALIAVESGWNPGARSPAGARGLGQLMPRTAASLGVDRDDPVQNIAGAARQLRILLDSFRRTDPPARYALALAAYNAGAAAVVRYRGVRHWRKRKPTSGASCAFGIVWRGGDRTFANRRRLRRGQGRVGDVGRALHFGDERVRRVLHVPHEPARLSHHLREAIRPEQQQR